MADTSRTLAALQALLADNTSGAISPQDLRDMLLSLASGYGSITVLNGSTAQTSISATPAALTGFAANGPAVGVTPDHTADTITVATEGHYRVTGQFSFSGTASKIFLLRLYLDGVITTIGGTGVTNAAGTGGTCGFSGVIAIPAAGVLSVYVHSSDGGTSITPSDMQLSVTRVD